MRVFDVHTHVFPDNVAHRAIEHLRILSHGVPAFHDGTLADHARKELAGGVCGWMNCPVATSAKQMASLNRHAAETNVWPHLSLGGLYPSAPVEELLQEVGHIRELGLHGVKLHPEYQGFSPLDSRLTPLWEALAAAGLPVLFHAGLDVGFPGQRHSRPADFAELARRFPRLTIVCAHLGGWLDWDEVEAALAGAPVYLDTSFAKMWMTDQGQFERIIRKHGASRVLFGTDAPWTEPARSIAEVTSTGLSDGEKQAILWDNAARLFKLDSFIHG